MIEIKIFVIRVQRYSNNPDKLTILPVLRKALLYESKTHIIDKRNQR